MTANRFITRAKTREWLKRYIPAEILGTSFSLVAAWLTYSHTHSYLAAAASGWVAEGVGFFGYFITNELFKNHKRYDRHPFFRRIALALTAATTNLLVEFLPAEILDNILIRPFLMYFVPHHIHPYALGFLIGKLLADVIFYLLAILGFEARKYLLKR